MEQIISDFQADGVDLMVGVATPVAMRMQASTEGTDTPVVFSAVSDPVGAGLVESLEAPGANLTGTSDYLDTASIMKLIEAVNPDTKKIGLYMISDRIPLQQPSRQQKLTWMRTESNMLSVPEPLLMKFSLQQMHLLQMVLTQCYPN